MGKNIDRLWIIYDKARNNEVKLHKKGESTNIKDSNTGKKLLGECYRISIGKREGLLGTIRQISISNSAE